MTVTCLSSSGAATGTPTPKTDDDENELSVSLLVEYFGFRYFVGGDIHTATEAKIVAAGHGSNVDVYQANHHGSHTSSSKSFMEALSPTVIVISNGNHGGHKHPRQVTMDTYAALTPKPTVFQTNKYLKGGEGGNVESDAFIADPESV